MEKLDNFALYALVMTFVVFGIAALMKMLGAKFGINGLVHYFGGAA